MLGAGGGNRIQEGAPDRRCSVADEIQGPHLHPQGEQVRAAASGRRWDAEGLKLTGGSSTLVVIYCPLSDAWVFYLDTDPRTAVLIPRGDVAPIASLLSRRP